MKVETAYIQFIINLANKYAIKSFNLRQVEQYGKVQWQNEALSIKHAEYFIRDCLREKCWRKLVSSKMVVHFGYDYYMYVGVLNEDEELCTMASSMKLYCERHASPYV